MVNCKAKIIVYTGAVSDLLMKKVLFYISLLVLGLTLLSFTYYISANTVLADKIFPKFSFGNSGEVLSENDVRDLELLNVLPDSMTVNLEGTIYSIKTISLNPTLDYGKLKEFGKGPDIIKAVIEGVSAIGGQTISAPIQINLDSFINQLPLSIGELYGTYENNGVIYNCQTNTFRLSGLRKDFISQKISDSLKNKTELALSYTDLTSDIEESRLLSICHDNSIILGKINQSLQFLAGYKEILFPNITLRQHNNTYSPYIGDDVLKQFLAKIKQETDVVVDQGKYEPVDNKIYMYRKYSEGKSLNIEKNLDSLKKWLDNPYSEFTLAYDPVLPIVANSGMQILDFTKTISEGKTRIDIIRNGEPNYELTYALIGLIDVNKTLIQPGEEFSYIKTLAPTKDLKTKNGNYIFSGFCNSTTTIFRAALEAGFKITDRSYHAHNIESFAWGYPLNIVDAAYFTDPVVDLKFINDLEYPVLLNFTYYKDKDGYQYHTVSFLSSEKAPTRKVELTNWQITNKYSATNFAGSFDRIVYQDNKVIRQDNFYSHYI